ncbi:MAG: DNA mismatch repair protein MutS, partial [Bryobacteraceae bacterium]
MQQVDAKTEYERRLKARRAASGQHERRHRMMGNLKVLTAVAAGILVWQRVDWLWLAALAAVFVVLLIVHERILRALATARRAEAFYVRGIERIDDRWAGTGAAGERFDDPAHPYASDLDLFGRGGLFQLLSNARTRAGEDTLATWLMHPADASEVRARQAAVTELQTAIDLREDLALLGEESGAGVHAAELAVWAAAPPIVAPPWARLAAPALVALLGVTLVGWEWFGWPLSPVFVVMLLEAAFAYYVRDAVDPVVAAIETPSHDLDLLAQVLVRLEREQFTSPRLKALRAALETEGHPASQRIARLDRLVEMLDSRDHLFMRVAGPLLLWTTQLAMAVEAWRARYGAQVPRWLEATGSAEAFSSVAAYSYEHPADPFPEIADEGPLFHGASLAHPLLPASRAVPNDVRLDRDNALLLVSGSNMSGKSTLLRTVGINTVLALAGAPVRAAHLRLSCLALGSSIRVHDSLQTGTSRFYAEVLRIRQVVSIAEEGPMLFLLDEVL